MSYVNIGSFSFRAAEPEPEPEPEPVGAGPFWEEPEPEPHRQKMDQLRLFNSLLNFAPVRLNILVKNQILPERKIFSSFDFHTFQNLNNIMKKSSNQSDANAYFQGDDVLIFRSFVWILRD